MTEDVWRPLRRAAYAIQHGPTVEGIALGLLVVGILASVVFAVL
jgi:hypothetical protein